MKLFPNKFFLECQAKHSLYAYYVQDTLDWMILYKLSRGEYEGKSRTSKRFILLRMALECILKAILIGLSKRDESAEEAYKAARNCGHNLEKLIKECKLRSEKRYRICSKETMDRLCYIEKFRIGIRYNFDMKTADRSSISKGVLDDNFHEEIYKDLSSFLKIVRRISYNRFLKHQAIRGDKLSELENHLHSLVK